MECVTLEGLWMISDRIVNFQFFVKFHSFGPAIIFSFWTITEHVLYASKKDPNQAKDLINMVSVTLEELWMISDRIVDFWFFDKFHRYGPAIIFSFSTIREHISYASKNVLIKQKTSSSLCVLLWMDYGWFLIEFSIFDFLCNFTGPDLQ